MNLKIGKEEIMSLGENIKRLRKESNLTQEELADQLDVSFQAISSWERDEYKPEMDKLIKLAEVFDISVASLVEEKKQVFKTKQALYEWQHMKTFVKTYARTHRLKNTLAAVDYACEAHRGMTRKKSDIPYIYHPLNLACHAIALDIKDDAIIAACLLHDVVEDCGKEIDELPVSQETKEIVSLLTKRKDYDPKQYYKKISSNPKACLVKCIDRCNNITTMSWGFSRNKIYQYIMETEEYYPKLLKVLKDTVEYNNAYWLLKYQIESMLDIYKRLL